MSDRKQLATILEETASESLSNLISLVQGGYLATPELDKEDIESQTANALATIEKNIEYVSSYCDGMPQDVAIHVLSKILLLAIRSDE